MAHRQISLMLMIDNTDDGAPLVGHIGRNAPGTGD
jgi:hypothetical protein